MPAGEGVVYSMAAIDGKWVAAISPQPEMQREAGAPPAWNSYITVRERRRDAGARQGARRNGARATRSTSWRPAGWASYRTRRERGSWSGSPGSTSAPASSTRHGALSWNELGSPDVDASAKFYGDLFGWTTTPMEGADPSVPRGQQRRRAQQRRHPAAGAARHAAVLARLLRDRRHRRDARQGHGARRQRVRRPRPTSGSRRSRSPRTRRARCSRSTRATSRTDRGTTAPARIARDTRRMRRVTIARRVRVRGGRVRLRPAGRGPSRSPTVVSRRERRCHAHPQVIEPVAGAAAAREPAGGRHGRRQRRAGARARSRSR